MTATQTPRFTAHVAAIYGNWASIGIADERADGRTARTLLCATRSAVDLLRRVSRAGYGLRFAMPGDDEQTLYILAGDAVAVCLTLHTATGRVLRSSRGTRAHRGAQAVEDLLSQALPLAG